MRARSHAAIVQGYWRPVHAYLRARWRQSPEDAEDLTQDFFGRGLERGLFARWTPERGGFRTYLRVCLDRHVMSTRRAAARRKRGGDARHVSLELEIQAGEAASRPLGEVPDPETLFHREWLRCLFGDAVQELRSRCETAGRPVRFALFERYDLDGPDAAAAPTYADLGREFGLPLTQVTNELAAARRVFRAIVRERLRAECATEAEFRAEMRAVLGGDGA